VREPASSMPVPASNPRVAAAPVDFLVGLSAWSADIPGQPEPLRWEPPTFGEPSGLAPEDAKVAHQVIDRYKANFQKINSLSFEETQVQTFTDKKLEEDFAERKGIDNYTQTVELRRAPLYYKAQGTGGDGSIINQVVTPAGSFTDGSRGMPESWIPTYLDGEFLYAPGGILQLCDRLRRDVPMDLEVPEMAQLGHDPSQTSNRYDVLENDCPDYGFRRSFWFNRQTGMLDYVIGKKVVKPASGSDTYEVIVNSYYEKDGVFYLRKSAALGRECQAKVIREFHSLVLNGQKVEDPGQQ